jgi:cyclopropane-fatty-acyl-phospholipid synthase
MPNDGNVIAQGDKDHNALNVPLYEHKSHVGVLAPERFLARQLLKFIGHPGLKLVLWDGYEVGATASGFTIRLHDRAALYSLCSHPELAFGDLYSAGRLTIDGDLVTFLREVIGAMDQAQKSWPKWLAKTWQVTAQRGANLIAARKNIHHHYDLGNEFYALWLDKPAMQYTCAYFEQPDYTLEQAQQSKMEHVCRKLRLKPGQTVIEAGCGWGGLARYMARHYGVSVRSYNISKEQLAFARERAREEGVADKVEYVEDDYRNIKGECDVFVSVGMLEHVGPDNYAPLAKVVADCLKPDGMGLIHSIGRNRPAPMNEWIEKRIFPGAYPPSIAELAGIFETQPLSVLEIENLRLHYARTLNGWLTNFNQNEDKVAKDYGDSFVRAWRLYLAGSMVSFETASLQLFQVVFTPEHNNKLRSNRRHLYGAPATVPGGLVDD